MNPLGLLVGGVCLLITLSACTSSGNDDLREWMQNERGNLRPPTIPNSAPSPFIPKVYGSDRMPDPFSVDRLTPVRTGDDAAHPVSSARMAFERNRQRQPLEAFPLDVMVMVGSLGHQGQRVALVKVDNRLHQVRPGQYLGQNLGKITRISEAEVVLREIVQDDAGGWVERPGVLPLNGGASK